MKVNMKIIKPILIFVIVLLLFVIGAIIKYNSKKEGKQMLIDSIADDVNDIADIYDRGPSIEKELAKKESQASQTNQNSESKNKDDELYDYEYINELSKKYNSNSVSQYNYNDDKADDKTSNEDEEETYFTIDGDVVTYYIKGQKIKFTYSKYDFKLGFNRKRDVLTHQQVKEKFFANKEAGESGKIDFEIELCDGEKEYVHEFKKYDEFKLFLDANENISFNFYYKENDNHEITAYRFYTNLDLRYSR